MIGSSESQFDVIVSRQLGNGLFDPLTPFKNWRYWLTQCIENVDQILGVSAWAVEAAVRLNVFSDIPWERFLDLEAFLGAVEE